MSEEIDMELLTKETNPKTLTNRQLMFDHFLAHRYWRIDAEGWSPEDIVNIHALIVAELLKRGLEHPPMDDTLDEESTRLTKKEIFESKEIKFMDNLPDEITLREDVLTMVGSFAEGSSLAEDIDIIIPYDIDPLIDFVYSIDSEIPIQCVLSEYSTGHHIPMYDLVLRKKAVFEKRTYDYLVPLGEPFEIIPRNAPSGFNIEPEFGYYMEMYVEGTPMLMHRDYDDVRIYDMSGNAIELPEIVHIVQSIPKPKQFIVEGCLDKNGRFWIYDMIRHSTTELLPFTLDARKNFIDKMIIPANNYLLKVPAFKVDPFDLQSDFTNVFRDMGVKKVLCKDCKNSYPITNWTYIKV